MCTLCVKIKISKIIFGTSLCYNRKKKRKKKKEEERIMQEERDKEIMGDRHGPT